LESSIKLDPRHIRSYKLLGKILAASSEPSLAEKYLRKAIEIDPDDANSYFLIALYYIGQDDYQNALTSLKKTINLNPYDEKALIYLGKLLIEEKKIEEAEAIYSKLYRLDPRRSETILALAHIEEKRGKLDKAKQHYLNIISYYPNNPNVYERYGSYLHRINMRDEALRQLQNAEILDLDNLAIKFKIAIIYIENRKYSDAIEKLDHILQKNPSNEASLYYKALSHTERGNYNAAHNLLKGILPHLNFMTINCQKAYIQQKVGTHEKHWKFLKQLIQNHPATS